VISKVNRMVDYILLEFFPWPQDRAARSVRNYLQIHTQKLNILVLSARTSNLAVQII